jgi:hypothetical protein
MATRHPTLCAISGNRALHRIVGLSDCAFALRCCRLFRWGEFVVDQRMHVAVDGVRAGVEQRTFKCPMPVDMPTFPAIARSCPNNAPMCGDALHAGRSGTCDVQLNAPIAEPVIECAMGYLGQRHQTGEHIRHLFRRQFPGRIIEPAIEIDFTSYDHILSFAVRCQHAGTVPAAQRKRLALFDRIESAKDQVVPKRHPQ